MEDCRYFEELIGAELDGELTDSEAETLHAHLETCGTCRAYREALRAMAETAAELPDPPAELTGRIMNAVRKEAAAKKTAKTIPFARYLRPVALAAAAALVIWAGWRVVGPKGASMTAAAPMAPMASVSMAAAEDAAAAEEAPAEEESFAVAEAAPLPAPEAVPAAGAAPETARDAGTSEESAYADTPMMAAANAAAEEPIRYVLCRGENGEPILEGALDPGTLRALLAADKPAEAPDREPDFVLLLPDTDERWLLWEEDGSMLVRENGTSDAGWTVGAEEFRLMFGLGE